MKMRVNNVEMYTLLNKMYEKHTQILSNIKTYSIMIKLLGSNYDRTTEIFTFYYHNTLDNWYYSMSCRNVFGTADFHARTPKMNEEQFKAIGGDRIV